MGFYKSVEKNSEKMMLYPNLIWVKSQVKLEIIGAPLLNHPPNHSC